MAINANDFLAALEEIEASKGISKDSVLQMLEDSLIRAYRKQLGGDDADVRVNIDLDKGALDMYQVKEVVDEVEDDFLQSVLLMRIFKIQLVNIKRVMNFIFSPVSPI